MSGWTSAILSVLVASNPLGVSRAVAWTDRRDHERRRDLLTQAALVGLVLVGIGLLAAPLLGLLDVSTQTFRLATAVVIGITGVKWLVAPTPPIGSVNSKKDATVTLATLMLTPAPVFAALTANSDVGTVGGIISAAIAVAATLVALANRRIPEPASGALVRFTGALALVVAIAVGLDSARSV